MALSFQFFQQCVRLVSQRRRQIQKEMSLLVKYWGVLVFMNLYYFINSVGPTREQKRFQRLKGAGHEDIFHDFIKLESVFINFMPFFTKINEF